MCYDPIPNQTHLIKDRPVLKRVGGGTKRWENRQRRHGDRADSFLPLFPTLHGRLRACSPILAVRCFSAPVRWKTSTKSRTVKPRGDYGFVVYGFTNKTGRLHRKRASMSLQRRVGYICRFFEPSQPCKQVTASAYLYGTDAWFQVGISQREQARSKQIDTYA